MIADLQERFQDCRETGDRKWQCRCPAHEDNKASLSVAKTDSKWLLYCHAGCKTQSILNAVSLQLNDLFAVEGPPRTAVAVYDYHDESGAVAYRVHRFPGKEFRQQAVSGEWSMKTVKRYPYRLPEVLTATEVFIVEGEKDVESLRSIGLVATCNSGGAGKWFSDFGAYFKGKSVVIIPDNDEPGEAHARSVHDSVRPYAAAIKCLRLPVPDKGDVTDWLQLGGTKAQLLDMLKPKQKQLKPVVRLPDECLNVPGIIGEIVKHNLKTALYPQPELALAAAIAFMGAVCGRRVTARYGTRTNVYILGVAPTGAGKEHARKVNKRMAIAAGRPKLMGSERIGSSSGLINQTAARPSILFQLDEMGRLLQTMNNPRIAPHLYNIGTVLCQFFTSADTYWESDALADEAKVKTIQQPNCCIYGTATPDQFWDSITLESITDGLLGRMMIFESRGYVEETERPSEEPVPDSISEALRAWFEFEPIDQMAGNLVGGVVPLPPLIPFTQPADNRITSHRQAIAARRSKESLEAAAVWSRSNEKATKLALIRACSRCGPTPEFIELEDVEWGIKVANYCTRLMVDRVDGHVSTNEVESAIKKLLRVIRDSGNDGISGSQLSRRTQWLKSRDRNEMLSHLQETEQIVVEIEPTKTKSALRYVAT